MSRWAGLVVVVVVNVVVLILKIKTKCFFVTGLLALDEGHLM